MRGFVLLFLLSVFYLFSSATPFSDCLSVSDLKEQVRWIKVDAVELAIQDMAKDSSFDKKKALEKLHELKELAELGFDFREGDAMVGKRVVRALNLYREIMY